MNLTKCFAASLCLTAMTASAGFLGATNDFEGNVLEGTWDGVNASAIVAGSTGVTDAQSPIIGVTDNSVLKLDTNGGVWTNTINQSFIGTAIWSDMLVKFVPSEDLPVLTGTPGKLAIATKVGVDGTNYLNVANNTGGTFTWAPTVQEISTGEWYRVTVKMYDPDGWSYADVLINGTLVCNQLSLDGSRDFYSIGFQGTGFIDEVVVRSDPPSFGPTEVVFGTGGQVILDPNAFDTWLGLPGNTGLTRENVGTDLYNAFLMGVAVDGATSPVLVVSSIAVGGTTTLAVKAKYANGTLVDLGTLNNGAVLTVWGKAALTDTTWQNLGTTLTGFNEPTYKFFRVTTGTNPNPI